MVLSIPEGEKKEILTIVDCNIGGFCFENFLNGTAECSVCDEISKILELNEKKEIIYIDEEKFYKLDEKLMFCKYYFQESLKTLKLQKKRFDINIKKLEDKGYKTGILLHLLNNYCVFQILEEEIIHGTCFKGLEYFTNECNTFCIFESMLDSLIQKDNYMQLTFLLDSLTSFYNNLKEFGINNNTDDSMMIKQALTAGFDMILLLQKSSGKQN